MDKTPDSRVYFPSANDPLGRTHVKEKHDKLVLELVCAIRLLATYCGKLTTEMVKQSIETFPNNKINFSSIDPEHIVQMCERHKKVISSYDEKQWTRVYECCPKCQRKQHPWTGVCERCLTEIKHD